MRTFGVDIELKIGTCTKMLEASRQGVETLRLSSKGGKL